MPNRGRRCRVRFSWDIVLQHCPSNCHPHTVQTLSGAKSGSFVAPDHEYPSYLELRLTVTDAGGLTNTKTLRLDPRTVELSFQSSPPGLQLVVGGSSSTTPSRERSSKDPATARAPTLHKHSVERATRGCPGPMEGHRATTSSPIRRGTYTATYQADTQPPTVPASLAATAVSSSQVNLTWGASSDNVGVTGYRLERCQGGGCSNFLQVATPAGTSYSDGGYLQPPVTAIECGQRMDRAT